MNTQRILRGVVRLLETLYNTPVLGNSQEAGIKLVNEECREVTGESERLLVEADEALAGARELGPAI